MRSAPQFHRLDIPAILLGVFVMAISPSIRAQVIAPDGPASEGTASVSSAASADSSSASQGETQAQQGILNPSRTGRGSCDLVSGPLTCLSDIWRDQAGIWTAPIRLRARKLLWLVPFAAATTLAFEYDVRAMRALGPSTTRVRVSNDFTHLGSGYVLAGAAGATYLFGTLEHKDGPREAGMLSLEAVADATLVVEGLKLVSNRQRPYVPPGTGTFWPDHPDVYTLSSSFPSGHAAATWALARVTVEETPGHPWLHVLMYGLATGVAIGRVTGENHFPADALLGSVIGYTVGGYVYHHRSAFYKPRTKSVRIEPLYNPATASYGVSVAIGP